MISLKVKGNWAENYIEEAMINLKTQEQDSNNGHTKEEKKNQNKRQFEPNHQLDRWNFNGAIIWQARLIYILTGLAAEAKINEMIS